MIPDLDSVLGFFQERISLVRQAHGSLAIGEINNDCFRTIRNPFTLQAHDGEDNVSPLYLKIPEVIESEQTL